MACEAALDRRPRARRCARGASPGPGAAASGSRSSSRRAAARAVAVGARASRPRRRAPGRRARPSRRARPRRGAARSRRVASTFASHQATLRASVERAERLLGLRDERDAAVRSTGPADRRRIRASVARLEATPSSSVRRVERRRHEDAPVELVHGSGRPPARAGADLPAVRGSTPGGSDEVAEPGSFATTRAGDVPVVLVRDEEGTLRAFLNVCRHRGSLVCSGSGRRASPPVPVPRLDVRARRAAPERSPLDAGGRIETDGLGLVRLGSRPGDRSCSSTRIRTRRALSDFLEDVPERIADAGIDVGRRCASSSAPSPSSRRTGRSARRTSSSATTARPRIPASPRSWTSPRTRTCSRRDRWRMSQVGPLRPEPRGVVRHRRARSSAASSTSSSRTPS